MEEGFDSGMFFSMILACVSVLTLSYNTVLI
jgi:hypothetical protein